MQNEDLVFGIKRGCEVQTQLEKVLLSPGSRFLRRNFPNMEEDFPNIEEKFSL